MSKLIKYLTTPDAYTGDTPLEWIAFTICFFGFIWFLLSV